MTDKKPVTLLIDGDVVAFIAAAAVQHTLEDDYGYIWPFANKAEGEAAVENILYGTMQRLKADGFEVYLSHEGNWRKLYDPLYKANRKDTVRPLLLAHLRDYLREKHEAEAWNGLEADDVVSIIATSERRDEEHIIVCGRDKDFGCIPGRYHDISKGDDKVVETTLEEANRFHLVQTLAGDRVDNYGGCPGIGMTRAKQILEDPHVLRPSKGIVTRGPRKGEETTRWIGEPTKDLWACIESHYAKAGLGSEDALRNARLAYILRAEDYDMKTGRITLWEPDFLRRSNEGF
jgi:DNA polymerase-1